MLFHPRQTPRAVRSANEIADDVGEFHEKIGTDGTRSAIEARRWREAVGDARDGAVDIGGRGAKAVGRFSARTLGGAKSGTGRLVESAADRLPRRRRTSTPSSASDDVVDQDSNKQSRE